MTAPSFLLALVAAASAAFLIGLVLALGLFSRPRLRRAGFRVARHD